MKIQKNIWNHYLVVMWNLVKINSKKHLQNGGVFF